MMSIRALVLGCTIIGAVEIQAQQPGQAQASQSSINQAVTFNGCIYRASDQPTMLALERTADADTTGTQPSAARRDAAPSSVSSAVGTSGSAAADAHVGGAWYRVTATGSQSLEDYVGKAVRVTGTITPGRDEKGADVVIHRFEPDKVKVTVLDLKPAPQVTIESITHVEGQCWHAK